MHGLVFFFNVSLMPAGVRRGIPVGNARGLLDGLAIATASNSNSSVEYSLSVTAVR